MLRACAREPELAEAVRSGRWPLGCEPELRAHVQECRRCGEMAMLTAAFQQARAQAVGAADLPRPGLPNAGLLWWRAQLRPSRNKKALTEVSCRSARLCGTAPPCARALISGCSRADVRR